VAVELNDLSFPNQCGIFVSMEKPGISLYEIIYKMVKKIPKGKVATYGQIARFCGFPEHVRLVGYALHHLKPDSGVPWHRVVNSRGTISLRKHTGAHERQKRLLEREGVKFKDDIIDLSKYGFGDSRKLKQQRGPLVPLGEEARPRQVLKGDPFEARATDSLNMRFRRRMVLYM